MPCRRWWLLRRTDYGLRRSDPHLAVMLAIFARLYAGEAITSREHAHRDTRARRALARLADMMAGMAVGLADCTRWVFRRVAVACAVVRWRFSARAGDMCQLRAWNWPTAVRE